MRYTITFSRKEIELKWGGGRLPRRVANPHITIVSRDKPELDALDGLRIYAEITGSSRGPRIDALRVRLYSGNAVMKRYLGELSEPFILLSCGSSVSPEEAKYADFSGLADRYSRVVLTGILKVSE